MQKLILFLLSILIFSSCKEKEKPALSFYYWKTQFQLNFAEKEVLEDHQIQKLYIRYFDIDIQTATLQTYPKAPIRFIDSIPAGMEIIPVIYIKNKVLENSSLPELDSLAHLMLSMIQQINQIIGKDAHEIQLDCDWTVSTADKYFHFIESLKTLFPHTISATIRLHQIKYPEMTGVPPVDKGVLMYYNIGEISSDNQNSIYEKEIAKKYVKHLKNYPLPLDIALPIFAWGQQIRNNKVIKLLNKIDINSFKNDSNFVALSEQKLQTKHAFFKAGYYFQENDIIKLEYITEKDLFQIAKELKRNYSHKISNIIFYDLDMINLNRYEKDIFEKLADYLY